MAQLQVPTMTVVSVAAGTSQVHARPAAGQSPSQPVLTDHAVRTCAGSNVGISIARANSAVAGEQLRRDVRWEADATVQ